MKPWLILGFTLFLGFSFLAYEKRHEVQQVGKVLDSASRSKDFMNRTPELIERRIAKDMLGGRRVFRNPPFIRSSQRPQDHEELAEDLRKKLEELDRTQPLKPPGPFEPVGPKSKPLTFSFPRKHTIKAGESWWVLAVKYYGKGYYHPVISAANRGVRFEPGKQMTIPAPPPEVVKEPTMWNSSAVKQPAPQRTPGFYTVKRGDTLLQIARDQLGSTRHVDKLKKANKHLDLDFSAPVVGTRLRIPGI